MLHDEDVMNTLWFRVIAVLTLACVAHVWAQAPKPGAAPVPAAPAGKPAAGAAASASNDSVVIGYLDGQRIEVDTRRAWEISEVLRKELGGREAEVRELEARVKSLQAQLPSITQPREREIKEREFQQQAQRLQQAGRAFVDDLERRKGEERRKYFLEVGAIVNKIAESRKFDLVVQEAVFAGKAIDITEEVIKLLGGPSPVSPAPVAPRPPAK